MLSAIQIQRHVFSRVEIVNLQPEPAESGTERYTTNVGLSEPNYLKESDSWALSLNVTFGPPEPSAPVRYQGHLTIHGEFKIHPDFPADQRESMLLMNGASLLLGAVREMVLTVTSRSIAGELMLATFDARAFLKPPEPPPTGIEDAPVSPGQ